MLEYFFYLCKKKKKQPNSDFMTKKIKSGAPKTPEAEARKRLHQFGQPLANPHQSNNSMREFYRWVESKATMAELREYINDESKPYIRRRFILCFMKCEKVQDYFDLTNQTHGYPKAEVQAVQNVEITLIHDTAENTEGEQ